MLGDLVVALALVMTVGFGYAAYAGSDVAAAWLAGGLAVAGVLRLLSIVLEAYRPDY